MSVQETVDQFAAEIAGEKRPDVIADLQQKLIQDVDGLSNNEKFFTLPLEYILPVIEMIDFSKITDQNARIDMLRKYVKNAVDNHIQEQETILVLHSINPNTVSVLTYEEILSIFELIKNCPFLQEVCRVCNEQEREVEVDFDYELKLKDDEIAKLQKEIEELEEKKKNGIFSF